MLKKHLLVVDDDQGIRELLSEYLCDKGYAVIAVSNGKEMFSVLNEKAIDLIILDIMLPGDDGFTLCQQLRNKQQTPVLMLTASGEDVDRILGLELGADDYMAKPFNPRELLARIKAILRRSSFENQESLLFDETERFQFQQWSLDVSSRSLFDKNGNGVALSSTEYRLLFIFLTHANRVLTRDQLMDFMNNRTVEPFDRSIDVQVSRLRQRLGDDARSSKILKTIRGEGYLFACKVEKLS